MLENIKVSTEFGLDFYELDDLERYKSITLSTFTAFKYNDNIEDEEVVGNAKVYAINTWLGINNIFDIADDISQDFINTVKIVSEKVNIDEDILNIIYVDRIEIDEKHRNNGYGTKLLEFISSYYQDVGDTLIILCANPLCNINNEEEIEKYRKKHRNRLYKFYKKQCFKRISNENTYFYKII